MSLEEQKIVYVAVTGLLLLLVSSPALERFLVPPKTEFFTEFWLLGPNHKAEDYPFNVSIGSDHLLFLGIGNRLGHTAYYKIAVKFRNQTQSAPYSVNRTPSSLPALFNITAFVSNEGIWELPLTFSLDYAVNQTSSQIEFHLMRLNDIVLNMENYRILWDSKGRGFFGNLLFELWIYNATSGFRYHERFVSIWLNMTSY